jgi:hypothetical protein
MMTPVFMEKKEIKGLIVALKLGQFYYSHLGIECENKPVTEQINKLKRMLEPCPFNGDHTGGSILWCAPCNYKHEKWKN